MKKILPIVVVLTTLLISCEKKESVPESTGGLKGKVLNQFDQPIAGASVRVSSLKTTSNSQGNYSFGKLPVDKIQVIASKEFFLPEVKEICITEN